MRLHAPIRALFLLLPIACQGSVSDGDPIDDDVDIADDGKFDGAQFVEATPQACGMLRVANELDFETLDEDVKLDRRAAENIVAYRAGTDGIEGTADDGFFDSLGELDEIKFVGNSAFNKIGKYVAAEDMQCTGVDLRILTISDWHGQLDPVNVPNVGPVGGAAVLSSYFQNERIENRASLTLTAGDAFGATPPLASFFEDVPVVLAMNRMGFSADALGNHNFDRGVEHLASLIDIAEFPYLSANLTNTAANLDCPNKPEGCVNPWRIMHVGGVKVALVGITNEDASNLVKPGAMGTIEITNAVDAAMSARAAAAAAGAQVFVVMTHMGATGFDAAGPTGPLLDFAGQLSGFDVVIGDHTNVNVDVTINGARVIENRSNGMTYARIGVRFDYTTGQVTEVSNAFVQPVGADVTPDASVEDELAPFRTQLTAVFDGTVATSSDVFVRGNNIERLQEVALGNLVAEAIRDAYGVQIGFINGGGLRAPMPSSYAPADLSLRRPAPGYAEGPPFDLVVGDVFAVLPFDNIVVTQTVTGEVLWQALELGVQALPGANGRFPQIAGIRYTFDSSLPTGSRVQSVSLDDGTPIAADATTYTMATSDFMAAGGDGYAMFVNADAVTRDKMAEVVVAYVQAQGALVPTTDGRIHDLAAQ